MWPDVRIIAGIDASTIMSLGTCRLVMPRSLSTIARAGPSASPAARPPRWPSLRSGSSSRLSSSVPRPSFGLMPASASASPCSAKSAGKKARTTCPKMIGSDTFIIVALRCTENSTPSALARAICSSRNVAQRGDAHHGGVDDLAGQHRHRLAQHGGGAVVADQLDAQRAVGLDDGRLLVGAEVVGGHVGDVGLGVGGPRAHRVRVLPGVLPSPRPAPAGRSCPRAAPG